MAIGVGITIVIYFGNAWASRRRKTALNERPPQKTKLRRPPGYSAQKKVDELSDKFSMALLQSIFAGALFGLLCNAAFPIVAGLILRRFTVSQIWSQPHSYYFICLALLTLSSLAWMVASIIKAVQFHREMRTWRFGLRGEQAVAEALADASVILAGYTAIHDVPGDGEWNIDHVVVGPAGIYVLEAKTRPRRTPTRNQPDNEVWYDGNKLQFPWCYDSEAVKQAERNARWVREFITGFAPNDMVVQPIIVVPGWYCKTNGNWPVKVMNAKYLSKHLSEYEGRRFTSAELQPLIRRFDERCRDLEF